MLASSSDHLALQRRVSEIEVELIRLRGELAVVRIKRGEYAAFEVGTASIAVRESPIPISYMGIHTLSVRERFNLMEELWRSIWDKSPSKWFRLTPLIEAELEKRCEDGRL